MLVITGFYGRGLSALCPIPSIVTLAFKCKLTLLGNHPNFVGAALFLFSCDWFWIFTILFTSIWRTAEDHTYCGLYSSTCRHEWFLKWWIVLSTRLISVLRITQLIFAILIRWIVIYPVESAIKLEQGVYDPVDLFGSLGWFSNTTGAANWVPEVVFSPFCPLSRRQLTFPSCC